MRKVVLTGVVTVLGWAAQADAQWLPLEGKAFVDINGLYQAHSQELAQQGTFSLYDERGTLDAKYGVDNGGLWDFGFGYRVWRDLSVGLGLSQFQKEGPATVTGSVPHPLFFDRPRTSTKDLTTNHKSRAIYLQAIWNYRLPDVEKLNLSFMIGPTHLRVTQELAIDAATSEVGAPYSSVNVTPAVVGPTKSTIGVLVGADISYRFHPNVGAGLLLRYLGGNVELRGLHDETMKVDAAGFQVGGGVRLRF